MQFFVISVIIFVAGVNADGAIDGNRRACAGLKYFSERQVSVAMPILLQSINEVQNDFVALEYIGAAYSMAARRLANLKRKNREHHKKLVKQEKDALQQACFYFGKAIAAYDYRHETDGDHSTTIKPNIDPSNYPQIQYANDHRQVLRSYGDALRWLGKKKESHSVFERGVYLKLWKTTTCRPINPLPVVEFAKLKSAQNVERDSNAYFLNNKLFSYILDPIQKKILPALKEIFSVKALRRNESLFLRESFYSSHFPWRPDSGGLARGGGWYSMVFSRDGIPNEEVLRYFPKLKKVFSELWLETHPSLIVKSGQVKLSLMTNGTHVRPHAGPSNSRLRMHCALIVPNDYVKETRSRGLFLRVGNQKKKWEIDQCFIFDESCEHEVKLPKSMDMPRLVLIVDFANILLETRDGYINNGINLKYLKKAKSQRVRERIMQTLDNEYYNFHENLKRNARQGIENSYQADML
eukprot:g13002.t1